MFLLGNLCCLRPDITVHNSVLFLKIKDQHENIASKRTTAAPSERTRFSIFSKCYTNITIYICKMSF